MNPLRYMPIILLMFVISEMTQIFQGISQIEHAGSIVGTLTIVSAGLHVIAFYLGWLTLVALREAMHQDVKEDSPKS